MKHNVFNALLLALLMAGGASMVTSCDKSDAICKDPQQQFREDLKDVMSKNITSIIVQGTECPALGQLNAPFGVNSDMLIAYYGEGETQFPTTNGDFYELVGSCTVLTPADLQVMGMTEGAPESGILMNENEGNAGTIYLTINPNEAEFDSNAFSLVNSRGEETQVQLSPVVPSHKLLTFGYTRAGSPSGFYETKATIAKADLDVMKPNWNEDDLRTAASDFVQIFNGAPEKMGEMFIILFQSLREVLPAYALKYTWTDMLGTHSNTSNYGVLATVQKPLSYSFMKDEHPSIPLIDKVEDLLGLLVEKIAGVIPDIDLSDFHLTEIRPGSIIDQDEAEGTVTCEVILKVNPGQVAGGTYPIYDHSHTQIGTVSIQDQEADPNGMVTGTVTVDMAALAGDINEGMNDLVADINNQLIDRLNQLIERVNRRVNSDSLITNVKRDIHSLLEMMNNDFGDAVAYFNKMLQPSLFAQTSTYYEKLSGNKNIPTVVSGGTLTLAPTSYSAELLAPAYKKAVAVSNVYKLSDYAVNAQAGDADCLAKAKTVNEASEHFAKVLSNHQVQYMTMTGLVSGYVYEIVYTSVDYYGKVNAKKYYVRVE